MVTTRPPKTIVKPTALGPVANTDTKLRIYGLFQKGRVLAQDGVRDLEVSEKAKRRRFSAEYKLRIVREADACKGDGDVAALLRREGLYSSHLSSWRRQRDEIAKAGLTSRKRGRKAKAEAPRIKELERENARLQRRLARVETMLEIQKKASELLGIPLNPIDDDEND